jgi:hypothetical protein
MKEKEKRDRDKERWGFYENPEVEGETIRDVLQSLLVLSSPGTAVVTDFTGTILLKEDLEKGNLPHLDEEAFIFPIGLRFLVPQPVDKEGKRLFFNKATYIPSLIVVPKCKSGFFKDYPILDHPYYIWTDVPDWLLELREWLVQ